MTMLERFFLKYFNFGVLQISLIVFPLDKGVYCDPPWRLNCFLDPFSFLCELLFFFSRQSSYPSPLISFVMALDLLSSTSEVLLFPPFVKQYSLKPRPPDSLFSKLFPHSRIPTSRRQSANATFPLSLSCLISAFYLRAIGLLAKIMCLSTENWW